MDFAVESLTQHYSTGSLTPSQVVEEVYRRIDACEDKAIWIDLVPVHDALAAAKALETKYLEVESRPILFGIPFSVKNSIDIAGFKTTVACESFAYTPKETAPAVARCLEAGAILIGTTNLDQFATGLNGARSPYGAPRSCFDKDYISGGSSSGSAVSVGHDLVSFSLGTDTAGSTRVPANFNGLIGLKPTLGTVSARGLVPACKLADTMTVLAKTVECARRVYSIVKWYDEQDDFALLSDPVLAEWPNELRLGVPPDDLLKKLSPAYAKLYKEALEKLVLPTSRMRKVTDFDYTPFESANQMLYGSSVVAQRVDAFREYLDQHGVEKLDPSVATIFKSSMGFTADQAYRDMFQLRHYKNRVDREFRNHIDVLVVPSTVTHFTVEEILADPLERNKLLGSFTHFVNLVDLCAIAVPFKCWKNPKGNDLPFGITLIAPAGRDHDLMNLAEHFQGL